MSETEGTIEVGFADLGLRSDLVDAVIALGYEEPTPIQRESIPVLLEGHDLLGQAATGTGKTAAFALPILHRIQPTDQPGRPAALVLVPTRELAMQVAEAIHKYGRKRGARVLPVYGGQPIGRQIRALDDSVDVVVATPGRALDHLNRGTLSFERVSIVVLDEADEMLDMGFAEDLDAVLSAAPKERQTVLFSATLPRRITEIAERHLKDPRRITIQREPIAVGEAPKVRQTAYVVPRPHKVAALGRILDMEMPTATLVFCRTRNEVDELTEALNIRGYRAEALHGGLSQEARDRVMRRLRSNVAELLVATDVAARGLDIDVLTHVVNYDVPSSPETYVHRIGRVGRAGREGVAITLAEPREHRLIKNVERMTRTRIEVSRLPTVADLRARRLELTRAAIREALLEGGLDTYRAVIEGLADEFDVVDVALAAVKLAHEAGLTDEEDKDEIPDLSVRQPREPREFRQRDDRPPRPPRQGGPPQRGPGPPMSGVARIWIGAGRDTGLRPRDIVGAITHEAGVQGRAVGSVQIAERFSVVEVDESVADEVIEALRATSLRGRKVRVRRDRFE